MPEINVNWNIFTIILDIRLTREILFNKQINIIQSSNESEIY